MTIPSSRAKINPRIVSPPRMNMASSVTIVVPEVFIVRDKVEHIALLIFSAMGRFG